MTQAISIIFGLVILCWIGSIIAYILENRGAEPSKSFQTNDDPFLIAALQWMPSALVWIAILLIAPIYIIEWLARTKKEKR